ncbi:deaminase [Devosia geojensis]|uniref:Deaminase n=1 Tax=Devosia geojensis TaxID=443610 RepID=A0A0F5FXR9_9HYPH|nr:dihydrofolate reductase family protein [Devosia geojensis]KKB12982.1 deaminase [Devosia geojensis]
MEHSSETDRPRVVVAVNASVDGRIALRRNAPLMQEESGRIWHALWPASTRDVEAARTEDIARTYAPQAMLEGSGSLVAESAGSPDGLDARFEGATEDLYSDFLPVSVRERPGHGKWFTVVDSRGRIRWTMKHQGEYDVLVLVARATPPSYLAYLRAEGISYLVAGEERVDLAEALRRMRDRLAVTCVVSTAGGSLNGALLRAGLVDVIDLLVGPMAIGGADTPSVFDGPPLEAGAMPTRLRLVSAHVETDGLLRLRYDVERGL